MLYFASDLHITLLMWKNKKELAGDSYRALNALADAIIEQDAAKEAGEDSALILAGDVFDKRSVRGTDNLNFRRFVEKLVNQDIQVYFIQGNHDRDQSSNCEAGGAIPIHNKLEYLCGHSIYGIDYMPKPELRAAVENAPACDILILHCSFQHLIHYEGAAFFSTEDIPEHIKNVVVGDTHVTNLTPLRGTGAIISPGALHPCNLSQGGQHGFWTYPNAGCESEDPEECWQFHEIPTRPIYRYLVQTEEELLSVDAICSQFESEKNLEPIMELRYVSDLTDRVATVAQKYKGKVVFFLNTSATGKILRTEELKELQDDFKNMSMVESVGFVVNRDKEPGMHEFLSSLLTNTNISEIVDGKVQELSNDS
jgi:DNA repair exonuclease SbcCD nuclease subunit